MSSFSFSVPVLPGKTDAWRKAVDEIKGPRNKAYKESRKKLGIKREQACLQRTPHGDFVVVHIDAKDPAGVMAAMMKSTSEFDMWFVQAVLQGSHGIDPKGPPPPMPEVVLDFKD